MNALSLWQPYAFFAVRGFKIWETRSRNIGIPMGELAIHASASEGKERKKCEEVYAKALAEIGLGLKHAPRWEDLPRGMVIGQVTVDRMFDGFDVANLTDLDRLLGDFTPGRVFWGWQRPIEYLFPVPAKGRQGVWQWTGGTHA